GERQQSARNAERDRRDDRSRRRCRARLPGKPWRARLSAYRRLSATGAGRAFTAVAARDARSSRDQVAHRHRVGLLFGRICRAAAGRLHADHDGVGGESHVVRVRHRQRRDLFRRSALPAGAAFRGLVRQGVRAGAHQHRRTREKGKREPAVRPAALHRPRDGGQAAASRGRAARQARRREHLTAATMSASAARPLAGLKVLELGQLIAGPFAGKMLAEFGAEVIKIESPDGGDPLRQWRLLHKGTSLWWYVQARNKKSVTANLRVAEGQEIVRRLARDADIVIENFRPGTLEKWGLGYDALSAVNPGLILLRLSGFGQTGPYRDQPGFGAVGESMGGMRHVTGFPDRPPVRMNISIGDALAALHGVIGVLMALHHREARSGRGQVVDVALYEAVFNMMESLIPDYDIFGETRGRIGTGLTNIVPSNTYTTRDGHSVVIAGNGDSIYKRLMHAIGRDDLGQDPALANNLG